MLHVARYSNTTPWQETIQLTYMEDVARITETLEAHALAAFDLMGADPALDGALTVLNWIKRERHEKFTFRDCHHALKSTFKRADDMKPAIEVLVERHFISEIILGTKPAHRPSRKFKVNPKVFHPGTCCG